MKLFRSTFFAILALWLSGCGASGINFNPNDMSKVVIGNNPPSPKDEPPLVPNSDGVLVRSAIPGYSPPPADPGPTITYSGIAN